MSLRSNCLPVLTAPKVNPAMFNNFGIYGTTSGIYDFLNFYALSLKHYIYIYINMYKCILSSEKRKYISKKQIKLYYKYYDRYTSKVTTPYGTEWWK